MYNPLNKICLFIFNYADKWCKRQSIKSNGIYKTRFIFLAVATGRVKGHTV